MRCRRADVPPSRRSTRGFSDPCGSRRSPGCWTSIADRVRSSGRSPSPVAMSSGLPDPDLMRAFIAGPFAGPRRQRIRAHRVRPVAAGPGARGRRTASSSDASWLDQLARALSPTETAHRARDVNDGPTGTIPGRRRQPSHTGSQRRGEVVVLGWRPDGVPDGRMVVAQPLRDIPHHDSLVQQHAARSAPSPTPARSRPAHPAPG